jgi:pyrroline-5-carboxylate reductase
MLKNRKVGFVGSGNMARALIAGLLKGNHLPKSSLLASNHTDSTNVRIAKEYGIHTTSDNSEVAKKADVVVLAVKPQVIDKVAREIAPKITKDKLVVSIAAGVTTKRLEEIFPKGTHVVRVMPNIPALVSAGASALARGEHTSDDELSMAKQLFDSVGISVIVDEYQMDAVTGLSGSGPAYIFLLIDALADAGVKVGLSRNISLILAANTVLGSAKLLIESNEHPGELKDMVTSPGGTAIAGIHTLEEGGLRTTIMNAVERATQRSCELGKNSK